MILSRIDEIVCEASLRHSGSTLREREDRRRVALTFTRAPDVSRALDLRYAVSSDRWQGGVGLRVRMVLQGGHRQRHQAEQRAALETATSIRELGYGGAKSVPAPAPGLVVGEFPRGAALEDLEQHHRPGVRRPDGIHRP